MIPLSKVLSGGQTGVDRAALDAALTAGLPIGGWCPRGRLAEDGVIDCKYPLLETPSADYDQRTSWNIRDSNATLIFYRGTLSGGSELTRKIAEDTNKPLLKIDLISKTYVFTVTKWLEGNEIKILNIAGPRESEVPGIYNDTYLILKEYFLQFEIDKKR